MRGIASELVVTRVGSIEVRRVGPEDSAADGSSVPTVVYLHSGMGDFDAGPFLVALAESAEVVAPLFPGFGQSTGIEQIDDMDDAVFHLLDLWDTLGLTDPIVVGQSLGGWMAVELAVRHPERVGHLVLVNPLGLYLAEAPIKDMFGRAMGELADDLYVDQSLSAPQIMHALDDLADSSPGGVSVPFELVRPVYETTAAMARLAWDPYMHDPKLPKRLWRATMPTLVIRAKHDTLVPAAHCRYYVDHLANARLVEVDRAAHLATPERPDEIAQLVTDFVEEPHGDRR
jgi:2-hydroxy-6-oxonona-2,4-dienedioate hydrolase